MAAMPKDLPVPATRGTTTHALIERLGFWLPDDAETRSVQRAQAESMN